MVFKVFAWLEWTCECDWSDQWTIHPWILIVNSEHKSDCASSAFSMRKKTREWSAKEPCGNSTRTEKSEWWPLGSSNIITNIGGYPCYALTSEHQCQKFVVHLDCLHRSSFNNMTNPGTTPITILAVNSDHGLSFAGEETRTMVWVSFSLQIYSTFEFWRFKFSVVWVLVWVSSFYGDGGGSRTVKYYYW